MNPTKPTLRQPVPLPSSTSVTRSFQEVILRLVKSGPARAAIEAGQIDAIVDPASGTAILLPEAQRSILERNAGRQRLNDLAFDWCWEQDEHHRFVSQTPATNGSFGFGDESIIGKALWDLSIDNMSPADWKTHRQQLAWRATFRDLEVRHVDHNGQTQYLAISGEPIFDDRNQFKGYRGIARGSTVRRQIDVSVQNPLRIASATLDALATPVCVLDHAGSVLLANRAWRVFAAAQAGIGSGICEGSSYLAACDAAGGNEQIDGNAIAAGIRQVIAGERALFRYDHAGPVTNGPAARCWYALCVAGVTDDARARVVVSLENITALKRAELLLGLKYNVARCLAESTDAAAGLKAVIRAVCDAQGWNCGRYFHLDQVAGVLRFTESWGVPVAAVERFLEESRGTVFRPGAGLAGRVAQSGQPGWVLEGSRDASVYPTALAPETGGDGAFAFPVTSNDETIGVLAFTGAVVNEPDDRMLQAAQSIGSQLGRFLQQHEALDVLRRSEARFRKLTELASDWYWEQDRDFRFTQCVGSGPFGACDVLGMTPWELPNVVLGDSQWAEHKSQLAERWSFSDFEFAVVHADGRLGYYCISGAPVYDDAGAFTGYCGTGLDITRRKRAEIAWRENDARLRAAASLSFD